MDWSLWIPLVVALFGFTIGLLNWANSRALYRRFETLAGVRESIRDGSKTLENIDDALFVMSQLIRLRERRTGLPQLLTTSLVGLVAMVFLAIVALNRPEPNPFFDGIGGFESDPRWAILYWLAFSLCWVMNALTAIAWSSVRIRSKAGV